MTLESNWFLRGRLKTRQLLLLVALADEGNIHRAAQVLNMAQPAASKLLKDLEDVLGVQLFERLPRGMRPTWYGETMVRHARIALGTLNQAHDEVVALRTGLRGQVGVGAITSPGLSLLPAAVAQVKRARPNLRVSVEIETSPVLLERLDQGKLDVLLARLSAEYDKTIFRYEPLTDERVCAVVRPGHPLLAAPDLTLAGLAASSWVVPPAGSVLRHRFDLMYLEHGLAPPADLIESSALLFITAMLQRSDMVAVLAEEVARYYEAHGMVAVLPIEMPCRMDAFGLITRTDRALSPGAMALVEALREIVAGAGPDGVQERAIVASAVPPGPRSCATYPSSSEATATATSGHSSP